MLAVALAVAGCGSGDDRGSGSGDLITVAATTGIVADIAGEIAGPGAEVAQIVPDGSSPHSYAPSAREQERIADADLLVYVDERLEADLPLEVASRSFSIAEAADAGADPHLWMDPRAVASALGPLAQALAAIDPAGAGAYRDRARQYRGEIRALDGEIERIVAAIPARRRKLVTSHDVLGPFAARYGFEVVGSVFELAPEAAADPRAAQELVDAIVAERVPAVFAGAGDDPELLRRIADLAEVELVDDLLVESLGPEARSYEEMMRLTAERIAGALVS